MFEHRNRVLSTFVMSVLAAAMPLMTLTGCGDEDDQSGAVTEDAYVVPRNEPATPLQDTSVITLSPRVPGRLTSGTCGDLQLTDEAPRLIISGKQTFRRDEYQTFISSRKLRVEDVAAPPGATVVQVDVSMGSPLELKAVPTEDRNKFVPAPVLHDNIGNVYWPIGYFLKDLDDDLLTIDIDLAHNFRDLNRLPPLSRSKRLELTLLYQVNTGVTLVGYSYGGLERRSFSIPVTN